MSRFFSNRFSIKLLATAAISTVVYKNFTENNPTLKPHYALNTNYSRSFYPASAEYPYIIKNRNIMSRSLTENLYAKLRDLRTPNGFTVDDAIQTGVENSGQFSTTGCVAGDEESYKVFRDLYEKVIDNKHSFKKDQRQLNDMNSSKLIGGQLDPDYILSVRVRTLRNIGGYCFPSFCTRGERRDVESLLASAFYSIDKEYKGVYYSLKELSEEEECFLATNNLSMDRPFKPEEISANLSRDWPDARGLWVNNDGSLAAFVNKKDHVLISSCEKNNDLQAAFANLYKLTKKLETQLNSKKWRFASNSKLGYLTTDPKDLGTGIKLSVHIKLPTLSQDRRVSALLKMFQLNQKYKVVENDDKKDGDVLEISSVKTMGKTEVEITQDFIDSINLLITAEKAVASGQPLDDILYK